MILQLIVGALVILAVFSLSFIQEKTLKKMAFASLIIGIGLIGFAYIGGWLFTFIPREGSVIFGAPAMFLLVLSFILFLLTFVSKRMRK